MLDLDVAKFFDSVDHDLMVKAVQANTDRKWVVLYVKRWLVAPIQHSDGSLHERNKGTPHGSAVTPVLANLFLHYAFDTWMVRNFPAVRFELEKLPDVRIVMRDLSTEGFTAQRGDPVDFAVIGERNESNIEEDMQVGREQ